MSRTTSRTVSGLAAVCLGLGASLIATPAWADSPQGASGTYSYTCDDQVGDLSESLDIEVYVAAPSEGEVGQEIEFQVEPDDFKYFSYTDGGEITSGTLTAEVALAGEAAPSSSASASTEAEGGFGGNNEETFDESSLSGTFTPSMPGEVTLSPGDITIDVDQSAGPSTTICSPDSSTDALATVDVTGEPAVTETPGDDGGGDTDGGASEQPVAAGDDGPPQALLIGGAVAGGLLVIVGLAMFGLMFYFMRRS
ncbi:hypothetical protein LP52_00975 [Streptomonospora alba]|uniref:Cell wall protein n=1 Tax=Streptomonospora alba TaxID=183763 RepID=A0A0C2JGK4_9ACTN|nr:hypothetical protein [Streptomonospora alba]KII00437.1 hypothetical protein LP52_00975 [Streptomonospora alba]